MRTHRGRTTHSRFRFTAAAGALALAVTACASYGGASLGDGSTTRSMRSMLVYEEIVEYGMPGSATLYQALERLRPEFLRPRRQSPSAMRGHTPQVYIETMHAGGLEVLQNIPVSHVQSVRYIRPVDALIRYGMMRDHDGGVILVTLGQH